MSLVTVSPKYQVVLPREIREALKIEPGQKIQVLSDQGRIVLVPVREMRSLRGFLGGMDSSVPRDPDRT